MIVAPTGRHTSTGHLTRALSHRRLIEVSEIHNATFLNMRFEVQHDVRDHNDGYAIGW